MGAYVRHGSVLQYRLILSHAGRLRTLRRAPAGDHHCGSPRARPCRGTADFYSFYFDSALSASPAALPSLLAFADASHITFGSDFPFAPLPAREYFADNLDTYDGLDEQSSRRSTAPTRCHRFRGWHEMSKVIRPYPYRDPYRVAAGGWRRAGIGR
jgi:hypothetical protein